jgi:uncharacterized protein (TIGR02300 family)
MAAKDLGTKHTCFKCGTKFYDMKKPAPICPKCGANQNDAPKSAPAAEKRVRAAPKAVAPVEPEVEVDALEDEEVEDEADEDDAAAEDEP